MDAVLKARINGFLEPRSESDGGGWAPVSEDDIENLYDIAERLEELKYGADADGDRPIQYNFVDRTKYYSSSYRHIPYIVHPSEGGDNLEDVLNHALTNLSIAMEAVRIPSDLLRMRRIKERNAK